MIEKTEFIRLDSQGVKTIGQIYSSLFKEQQGTKKSNSITLLDQRSNENAIDKAQKKLAKIIDYLKSNTSQFQDKTSERRKTEETVCKIIDQMLRRNEKNALALNQKLEGKIPSSMHLLISYLFYQNIPLDQKKLNPPLQAYYNAITNHSQPIVKIEELYNNLHQPQQEFFFGIHHEIIQLKQECKKFGHLKAGKSEKQLITTAKAESILAEINQKNQENDKMLNEISNIKHLLSSMAQLLKIQPNEVKFGAVRKLIEQTREDICLPLRKICSIFQEFCALINRLTKQNSILKQQKQILEQQYRVKIKEIEDHVTARSHLMDEVSSNRPQKDELKLKIKRLQQGEKVFKAQLKDYEDKLQQIKQLKFQINDLKMKMSETTQVQEQEYQRLTINLGLAKQTAASLQKDYRNQKEINSNLEKVNTQLKKDIEQLRSEILNLKAQIASYESQPRHQDKQKDQIIKNLRINEKNQKKNFEKLKQLYDQERNQRLEKDPTLQLKQALKSSQDTVKTLREDIKMYEERLHIKQVGNIDSAIFEKTNQNRNDREQMLRITSKCEQLQRSIQQKSLQYNALIEQNRLKDQKNEQKVAALELQLADCLRKSSKN